MDLKFQNLYNKIINESKNNKVFKNLYKFKQNNYKQLQFGFECPICHEFSTKTDQLKKYFICKYTPRCHGKVPYIDINSTNPADQDIVNFAREKYQNQIDTIKAKYEAAKLEKQQKAEAAKQELINIAKSGEKVAGYNIQGRIGNYNSAYDEYSTSYKIFSFKEIIDNTIYYNVYERIKLKTHFADSIPYKTDYQNTDNIIDVATADISDPLTINYKGDKYQIFEKMDPSKDYADTFQPSTAGT